MAATDPNVAEALLWAEFDNASNLNRKGKETEKDHGSNRHGYRAELEKQMALGNWTDANEMGVKHCARKAGLTARLIADYVKTNSCDQKLFNLASSIIAMCQAEDFAVNIKTQGIIC
jgi:hypothetical protein